jgi:putative membrane-bound dehydrogenase-like protein
MPRLRRRLPQWITALALPLAALPLVRADQASDKPATTQSTTRPDVRMRAPQEAMAMIQVPPGYRLELVAAEPQIINPVCLAWDGNGAMYVAEMRSYMRDIDATKEKEPISRVSRLESTRGDGVYDRVTTFADHLLLPRQILPLDERILIRETDTKDIYEYRDTDGDGVAEPRTRFYEGGPATGNLEHQSAHLTWNIDNWMYQTVDQHRLRFAPRLSSPKSGGKLEVDTKSIPFKIGQWGYATTDDGRMIFATAGAERPAHDFQVPLIYGKMTAPKELADKFTECYPLVKFSDVQGGPTRVWPDGGLNRFTGTAGPSIYRGDALPADLYGDYILPEPVGRLIRRAKITNEDGKVVISKAEPGKEEFIRSTDPNFRPVFSATGPDGCLYIVDMYRGIIQEGNWTREGSYLRKEILKYGLEKNIGAGRIYRLIHESKKPRFEKPRMLEETPAELVSHLANPNGWWRDTAQKLIVLKGDTSVVPALKVLAKAHDNPLARLHALWTLDGLASADVPFVLEKLTDADERVRSAAVRILEPQIQKNDPAVMAALAKTAAVDPDPNVAKQYAMSLLRVQHPQADALIKAALDAKPQNTVLPGFVKALKQSALMAKADKLKPKHLDGRYAVNYLKGKEMYQQACIACHADDGKGTPAPEGEGLTLAPPLKGSARLLADKSVPIHIVLKGLVGAHADGKTYPNEMATFAWFDDDTLAQLLTYARNDWGNKAPPVDVKDVRELRKTLESRTTPYTFAEISEILAKATPPAKKDDKKAEEKKPAEAKPAPEKSAAP